MNYIEPARDFNKRKSTIFLFGGVLLLLLVVIITCLIDKTSFNVNSQEKDDITVSSSSKEEIIFSKLGQDVFLPRELIEKSSNDGVEATKRPTRLTRPANCLTLKKACVQVSDCQIGSNCQASTLKRCRQYKEECLQAKACWELEGLCTKYTNRCASCSSTSSCSKSQRIKHCNIAKKECGSFNLYCSTFIRASKCERYLSIGPFDQNKLTEELRLKFILWEPCLLNPNAVNCFVKSPQNFPPYPAQMVLETGSWYFVDQVSFEYMHKNDSMLIARLQMQFGHDPQRNMRAFVYNVLIDSLLGCIVKTSSYEIVSTNQADSSSSWDGKVWENAFFSEFYINPTNEVPPPTRYCPIPTTSSSLVLTKFVSYFLKNPLLAIKNDSQSWIIDTPEITTVFSFDPNSSSSSSSDSGLLVGLNDTRPLFVLHSHEDIFNTSKNLPRLLHFDSNQVFWYPDNVFISRFQCKSKLPTINGQEFDIVVDRFKLPGLLQSQVRPSSDLNQCYKACSNQGLEHNDRQTNVTFFLQVCFANCTTPRIRQETAHDTKTRIDLAFKKVLSEFSNNQTAASGRLLNVDPNTHLWNFRQDQTLESETKSFDAVENLKLEIKRFLQLRNSVSGGVIFDTVESVELVVNNLSKIQNNLQSILQAVSSLEFNFGRFVNLLRKGNFLNSVISPISSQINAAVILLRSLGAIPIAGSIAIAIVNFLDPINQFLSDFIDALNSSVGTVLEPFLEKSFDLLSFFEGMRRNIVSAIVIIRRDVIWIFNDVNTFSQLSEVGKNLNQVVKGISDLTVTLKTSSVIILQAARVLQSNLESADDVFNALDQLNSKFLFIKHLWDNTLGIVTSKIQAVMQIKIDIRSKVISLRSQVKETCLEGLRGPCKFTCKTFLAVTEAASRAAEAIAQEASKAVQKAKEELKKAIEAAQQIANEVVEKAKEIAQAAYVAAQKVYQAIEDAAKNIVKGIVTVVQNVGRAISNVLGRRRRLDTCDDACDKINEIPCATSAQIIVPVFLDAIGSVTVQQILQGLGTAFSIVNPIQFVQDQFTSILSKDLLETAKQQLGLTPIAFPKIQEELLQTTLNIGQFFPNDLLCLVEKKQHDDPLNCSPFREMIAQIKIIITSAIPTQAPFAIPCHNCPLGAPCLVNSDCLSDHCEDNRCIRITLSPTFLPSTSPIGNVCDNKTPDNDESDIDCGGSLCPPCDVGRHCFNSSDCGTNLCVAGFCISSSPSKSPTTSPKFSEPTRSPTVHHCRNGIHDADESDADCGGQTCITRCGQGKACNILSSTSDCLNELVCQGIVGSATCVMRTSHPTSRPTKAIGASCSTDLECESASCRQTCCQEQQNGKCTNCDSSGACISCQSNLLLQNKLCIPCPSFCSAGRTCGKPPCCLSGQKSCGPICINSLSECCDNQGNMCPGDPAHCCGLHCMPAGNFCCADQSHSCPTGTQCCGNGCIPATADCCSNNGYCCNEGGDGRCRENCCGNDGCKPIHAKCCKNGKFCEGTFPNCCGGILSGFCCL